MIYIWEEANCVDTVFEAPAGLDISEDAFLGTLGLPPRPPADAPLDDCKRWHDARYKIRVDNGMRNSTGPRYREWLDAHPQVRSVPFEVL